MFMKMDAFQIFYLLKRENFEPGKLVVLFYHDFEQS